MVDFILREMQPADSEHVAALMREDQDSTLTTHFLLDTYTVLTQGDTHKTIAIVAVAADHDGLAGLATVSFGQVQFEGQVLPYASLDSWQVGQRFRKQGLASRLVQATIDRAETDYGPSIVLRSGLAADNAASRATASKWAREFFEPLIGTVASMRKRQPSAMAGITVREARSNDYPEIVEKQNRFYADFNLYEPLTVESLSKILHYAPSSERLYHYWLAETQAGDILAGALLRRRSVLMVDTFNTSNLPLPLRLANMIFRMIPSDNTLREIGAENMWYAPGQAAVAKHFWKMLLWCLRDKGTNITVSYDPRGPLAQVLEPTPRLQPRFEIAFAIRGPVTMSPDRFVAVGSRR